MKKTTDPNSIFELIDELKKRGIPEENYQRYTERLLEKKSREQLIPRTGHFELTPLCNLDCKMCFVHLTANQFDKKKLLSTDQWKHIISQAHNAGMLYASLTGGECLTYPGFDDIYLFLYNLGIIPSILSNGILIDDRRIGFFKQYPPRMIRITLYGSSEDSYEQVTGHRVYHTVLNNIMRLHKEDLPVMIGITPSGFMEYEFENLIKNAMETGIPFNINPNLITPRKNTGRSLCDAEVDTYVELLRIKRKLENSILNQIDLSELPDENHQGHAHYGLTCGAGRSTFGITYEGKMCPCLSLGEESISLTDVSFQKAWEQINSMVQHYPLPMECNGCVYYPHCLNCVAMHKNTSFAGHCNPRICERTKKMISAGIIPPPSGNNFVK